MIVIPFIIIGAVVITIAIILVKLIVAPKRSQQLAELFKQNKIPAAIRLAKQIIVKEPRNSDAHYYLGLCYQAESKPELALMEFKAVDQIGLFEGNIRELTFRNSIAELYLRFNQLEEAQKEFLLLLNLDPENPQYNFQAGKLFELRNHPDKAVKYYKKTIELDKRHADAYGRLGSLLFRAKRLPDARQMLEQAVKLQQNNAAACFTLGKIFKESKDYQTALGYFEKASKEAEFKIKSFVERGTCLIAMGDLERAEAELERAVKISTDDASNDTVFGRYLLAYCYEQARRYDEAIAQWERIQQKKPNFRDVPAKLAQYSDLRDDDHMKDYLTAGDSEFGDICKHIVEGMGLSILDATQAPGAYEILAGESQTKWRNTKKLPTLFWFARDTETVEEPLVRAFHERIRGGNIGKGVFVTSSPFSRAAREFAESRPIDLVDKEKLLSILNKAAV